MSGIAALILAGGKGERLGGVNKALLTIGDQRFIDRAAAVSEGCAPRLLAVGRETFEGAGDLTHILDLDADYAGPLAGLAAAVEYLAGQSVELLFSMAVDTPLFPSDFLTRALPLLNAAPAVLAAWGAQDYPTNAVWKLSAISDLPRGVRAGTAQHSLKRLAEALGAARLDYSGITEFDPFRNANTAEDLAYLRGIAERATSA